MFLGERYHVPKGTLYICKLESRTFNPFILLRLNPIAQINNLGMIAA